MPTPTEPAEKNTSSPTTTTNPRQAALGILVRFEPGDKTSRKGSLKSNILLDQALTDNAISDALSNAANNDWKPADRALLTALVYGILRQWVLLDNIISRLSKHPLYKITPQVRTLLRLGIYQMRFMDQIPDYAAVDTTMELAHQFAKQWATKDLFTQKTIGFLNGVLRQYQREVETAQQAGKSFPEIPTENPVVALSLTCSWPEWFVTRMVQHYPVETLQQMGAITKQPAPVSLRINLLKTTVDAFHQKLREADIAFHLPDPEGLPECLTLDSFHGSPTALPGFQEGHCLVQDPSSALVSHWLNPQPGETILDLCAAPGTKTSHLAAMMNNQGKILAVDPSPSRITLLENNCARLGVTLVEAFTADALAFELPEGVTGVDRVLIDVPCSGTGTIRRHPEILFQRTARQMKAYPEKQWALLKKGATLVKGGGTLVYSTCSIDPAENKDVVAGFLKRHREWTLEREEQRLINSDYEGFYLARLIKAEAPAAPETI